MNVLSLFDGMSCGQIALERLGFKVDNYFASEIKPHAIKVTQDNYPNTVQLGDVTKVDGYNLPKIDLLIGGSPCQDLSQAQKGDKRTGLNGNKSMLFYEYIRLLKEVQPTYFLLENVGGMKKEDSDIISLLLGVEPIKINSKLVSGQLRNRMYWTNCDVEGQPKDKKIMLQNILDSGWTDRTKARCLLESDSRLPVVPLKMFHRYYNTGFTTLIFKNEKHYHDCKKHYDDNFKGMSAKQIDESGIKSDVYKGVRHFSQKEMERLQTVPVGYTNSVNRNHAASLLGDGWTVDVIAHILKGIEG